MKTTDLTDYEAIKKHLPLATPKQVKWLKEFIDMRRKDGRPNPERIMELAIAVEPSDDEETVKWKHQLSIQAFAGMKGAIANRKYVEKRRREKENERLQHGTQCSLFHPEAFQGGSNETLREM